MIHSFWSLGMADPFPDEATMLDKSSHLLRNEKFKLENSVYPKSYMSSKFPPNMIYIPNRVVLIKMMRASFDCQNKNDLWLF
jgi:hypothetical protein